jgi:hypothetical protein
MQREPRHGITVFRGGLYAVGLALALLCLRQSAPGSAFADDLKNLAAQFADHAFALLNSLNSQSNGGSTNPALGPVAGFAGDAQTLSHAVAEGDSAKAAYALGALQSDRGAVDAALAGHPGALKASDWNSLKGQLDALAKAIGVVTASPPVVAHGPGAGGPESAGAIKGVPANAPAPPAAPSAVASHAPKVTITYRGVSRDGIFHVKGWFAGTALKSAGIYDGDRLRKSFKVNDVVGQQRVNFDIQVAGVSRDTAIRVRDAEGRSAEAPIASASEAAVLGGGANERGESGVRVDRYPRLPAGSTGSNTAEIPSHGGYAPSRSGAPSGGSPGLANVQINILGVVPSQTAPGNYEVVGQIAGRGIRRAGIYIDGRLVKPIPVSSGANFSAFDETFPMSGREATIRVYGAGNRYVESSIDVIANGVGALPPMVTANLNELSVQISSVQPVSANLYVVSGVIAGRNVSSAGLYQNGMLMQQLSVGGGLLGAFIPDAYRSVNFTARFNPLRGPAVIRVYDRTGASVEQPVMVAGYGINPYGANPYYPRVNPYNPYNPSLNPYNPYAPPANPYQTYPYGQGAAPYPNPPPSTPWWQHLMP